MSADSTMEAAGVRQVVVRFYSTNLLRSLRANAIIEQALSRFHNVGQILFEKMSDAERSAAASVGADTIIEVHHRLFFYARYGQELRRVEAAEREVERVSI
jgi:hypothetical protein